MEKITSVTCEKKLRCPVPTSENINELTGEVIGSAIEVHKMLEPGLMGCACEECLGHEFELGTLRYERRKRALYI